MQISAGHPGFVATALVMASGIAFYTAVQSLIFAREGYRRTLYLYFAAMSASAAIYLLTQCMFYTTGTTREAGALLQWQFTAAIVFLFALFGFVAEYSEQRRIEPWLSLLAIGSAILGVVNIALMPYSLRYASLEPAPALSMPWGEVLLQYTGTVSRWNFAARGISTAILLWAVCRAVLLYRRGCQRSSLYLGGALALLLLSTMFGLMIDLGYARTIYPTGLSFLTLVLFMSVSLGLDMRDINLSLKATTENLKREIELHSKAEDRIRHLAYHDPLTGLPNRATLQEMLSSALARQADGGQRGALIMLGLDDFQSVNDVLGHDIGDRLLRSVAERLRGLDLKSGTLTRLGGDEFILLLPDLAGDKALAEAMAQQIAEKCVRALSLPFLFEDRSVEIGACAGIVLFPDAARDETGLLQRVDMALSRAKSFGRSSIQLYASGMQAEVNERLRLERDMRLGMTRGEFMVYYQPQIASSGEVKGAEALLRWRHPEKGLISPVIFVPIAERSGLIRPMGDWVLQQTCEQIKDCERRVPEYAGHFSVNVSAWQFIQSNYEDGVRRRLISSGIDARRLTLEITESAFIRDMEEAIARINSLRTLGLSFSIDDFGTGYASLSYLRRLPMDELKVDQSFVRNVGNDLHDTQLVETIVNLGTRMGMRVVAEGVESELQRAALTTMNCWALQGFHLASPMDKETFLNWLSARPQYARLAS